MRRRSIAAENERALAYAATVEFENVESNVTIDDINQPPLIEHNIVALRCWTPARGLRNEITFFARRRRIGDVDNPQTCAEPHREYERTGHALMELMRAETRARSAGKW